MYSIIIYTIRGIIVLETDSIYKVHSLVEDECVVGFQAAFILKDGHDGKYGPIIAKYIGHERVYSNLLTNESGFSNLEFLIVNAILLYSMIFIGFSIFAS